MTGRSRLGAVAFQKGLGAIHAMSHPIGAHFNTHHGTTNAVCMPAVLDLNAPAIAKRFDQVAPYLGIKGGFDGFRRFVREFNNRFAIPHSLSALGMTAEAIPDLVRDALSDPSCGGNAVPLTRENLTAIFKAVL